jgi:ankyrin repeat protein
MDSDYLGRLKKWLNPTLSVDIEQNAPNLNCSDDFTALMHVAERGDTARVNALIRAAVDLDAQADKGGDTALIMAVRNGHIEVVKALIAGGANLNIQTHGYANITPLKYTALMYAIHDNQLKIVEILLKAKANPDLKDCVGHTAYTLASAINNQKIIALLNAESIKRASMISAMAYYLSPWSSPLLYSTLQISYTPTETQKEKNKVKNEPECENKKYSIT